MILLFNNAALTTVALNLLTGATTLAIYSGTMPTINNANTFTLANHTAQLLVSFPNVSYTSASPGILRSNLASAQVNATSTGTATWFAWYVAATTTVAIVGSISDVGPNIAPVYVNSVNMVSGAPVNLIQFGIKLVQ